MVSEIKNLTIGDTCHVTDGAHSKVERQETGVLYLTSKNIKVGNLVLDKVDYISETDYNRLFPKESKAQRRPIEGDVLIGIIGTFGNAYKYKKHDHFGISSSIAIIRPDKKLLDSDYLYYVITSPTFQAIHDAHKSGSAQGYTNIPTIKVLPIPVPPLPKQKAIAYILGSLDDKIELNRQMNETLEAMAQALFKSWFVDFDPVIDNALAAGNAIPDEFIERAEQRKGIEKKDNSDIQDLFPDEFEFTEEMGWIPKGWQELQIKDIAKVVKGKSYKSSELAESQTALVTLKSFKRGGGYRLDGLKEYTGKYKEEQEVKAGDLVIAYTDVTQAADLIGKPAMVIDDIRYKHLVISLDVAVVRPEIDSQKYYLYGLAQTEAFQSHNYSHSTGTTVLHLSKNAVPDYYLCLPSENLLHGFTKIVEPLFTSVNNNIGEIKNLEKIRDTLLPKLMSGELRIPDAAAVVDEAV